MNQERPSWGRTEPPTRLPPVAGLTSHRYVSAKLGGGYVWGWAKQLLSQWTPLGDAVADVVFEAPPLSGQYDRSLLQWRVKRRVDSGRLLISLKVIPDYAAGGADGAGGTSYIDFKPAQIALIDESLRLCMAECERLQMGHPSHLKS